MVVEEEVLPAEQQAPSAAPMPRFGGADDWPTAPGRFALPPASLVHSHTEVHACCADPMGNQAVKCMCGGTKCC
jgi:hypothetical protein